MNSYILTASGVQFDLEDPQPDMVCVADVAAALSKLCRFTGHTSRFYSVAQHSVLVSDLAGPAFAFEALLHDAAEAYVGDISTPLKQVLGTAIRDVERRIDAAVRQHFGLPSAHSPEVKLADIRALGMERDCFLPNDHHPWPILDGVRYDRVPLLPKFPAAAEELFLVKFKLLTGAKQ